MKAWNLFPQTLLSAILCAGLAASCTLKVGDGKGFDDTDDLDFDDKDSAPEPSDTETSDTETSNASGGQDTDTATTDTTETDATDTTESETDTTDTTDTGEPSPDPDMCPGDAEEASCEECIQLSCAYEWDNCCGTGCGSEWTNIERCMLETATDDALSDLDRCSEMTSPTGDALDLLDDTLALRSCVTSDFMGDPEMDPLGRQAGEGTCTFACFYVFNL